jgi:hypothetical protein
MRNYAAHLLAQRNSLGYVLRLPLLLVCADAAATPAQARSKPQALYVAPNGRDDSPGTQAQPLATLGAAQQHVR